MLTREGSRQLGIFVPVDIIRRATLVKRNPSERYDSKSAAEIG
jgi:hypothetical protein